MTMALGGGRLDPGVVAEVKRRVNLADMVAQSGLAARFARHGHDWKGCCPFHAERTPSFYVVEDKGFFHCFGCGAHGDAIKWVRLTTVAQDFREAVEYLAGIAGISAPTELEARPIARRPAEDLRDADTAKKLKIARDIWAGAVEVGPGSPVARYLRQARRYRGPIPPTLREHRAVEHPHVGRGRSFPAMVAPIIDLDRKIIAAHCTFLAPDGSRKMAPPSGWPPGWLPSDADWKPKIMRGRPRGGAIRLTAAEPVMVVAEGIETALALLQSLSGGAEDGESAAASGPTIDGEPVGVWAAGSLDNMGALALPDFVREVILAADSDGKIPDAANGAERKGGTDPEAVLQDAAARHRDHAREVRIARPPAGCDFNDMLPDGAGSGGDDQDIEEAA